jgi:hypothetical protein
MKVAHAGSGQEIVDAPACGVDGGRWVRGECRDVRADGLEAPGRSEDDALGSVVERCQRASGPEKRHGASTA